MKSGHSSTEEYDYWQCDDCDSTYIDNPIACDYCGSFALEGGFFDEHNPRGFGPPESESN